MCAVVRLRALMARQAARLITNHPIDLAAAANSSQQFTLEVCVCKRIFSEMMVFTTEILFWSSNFLIRFVD
jgi:hypothetical protein